MSSLEYTDSDPLYYPNNQVHLFFFLSSIGLTMFHNITGLTVGTKYYLTVFAENAAGKGPAAPHIFKLSGAGENTGEGNKCVSNLQH